MSRQPNTDNTTIHEDTNSKCTPTHLHQLPGVSLVEQVVDSIRIYADLARSRAIAGHLVGDLCFVVAALPLHARLRIRGERCGLAYRLWRRRTT